MKFFFALIFIFYNNFFYFFSFIPTFAFFKFIVLNLYFNDIFVKLLPSDSLFNYIAISWVNAPYLSLLPLILLLLSNVRFFILISLIFFFFLELQSFNLIFQNFYVNSLFKNNLNFLLKNNMNKIHPFLFYLGLCFFFKNYLNFKNLYQFKLYYNLNYYNYSNNYNFYNQSFYITLIALFLGSWWAFQEGSWGGWWNWDPSETLILISIASIVLFFHKNKKKKSLFFETIYNWLSLLNFLIFFFIVQFGFSLTTHNFGIKTFFFFSTSALFFEYICIILLFIINKFFIFYFFIFKNTPIANSILNKKRFKNIVFTFIFILFLFLFFFSFYSILKFFIYFIYKVDSLFLESIPLSFYSFVIIFLYLPLLTCSFYIATFPFLFSIFFFNLFLISFRKNILTYSHIFICFLIYFNIISLQSDFNDLYKYTPNLDFILSFYFLYEILTSFSLDFFKLNFSMFFNNLAKVAIFDQSLNFNTNDKSQDFLLFTSFNSSCMLFKPLFCDISIINIFFFPGADLIFASSFFFFTILPFITLKKRFFFKI